MVAVIKSGYSIHRILNYNENKVREGVATCIAAGNYPIDPEFMGFNAKLKVLRDRLELSHRAKRTSVHVSLNFDPSERDLPQEKLMEIADHYMQKIGFGKQPYLVYQHFDAGHPHLHIVSVNIKPDGKEIETHLIGKRMSEPARKSLEIEHGLVRAEQHSKQLEYRPEPIGAAAVEYGRSETKKAIQNVLEHVLTQYRYTSLPELNALLGRYNIMAQKGEEGSRVLAHQGLLYRIIDSNGKAVGVPIKASAFYNRPTLKNLQKYFDKGFEKRMPFRSRLKNTVDRILTDQHLTLKAFVDHMAQKGVDVVFRMNDDEFIFGITYVDHVSKCVFNGSALGKNYSAKAIQERCTPSAKLISNQKIDQASHNRTVKPVLENTKTYNLMSGFTSNWKDRSFMHELVHGLTQFENTTEYIPYELSMNKKKKRKKRK